MMNRRALALLVTTAAPLCVGCAVFARPVTDGAPTALFGTVVQRAPGYLDVRTKAGYVFRVALDGTTSYQVRERAVSFDCAVTGTRVRVTGVVDAGVRRAKTVSLFSGRCVRETSDLATDSDGSTESDHE